MKVRSGFSIIECLVYCFLFCLLCVLIFDWVGASQISLVKVHKKSECLLDEYSSMDSFAQDAMGASNNESDWKKIAPNEIIWQAHDGAIGWEWNGSSLYRITGRYTDSQWTNATKSLVNNSLKQVNFSVHKNKKGIVECISCSFNTKTRNIKLRNRRIDV